MKTAKKIVLIFSLCAFLFSTVGVHAVVHHCHKKGESAVSFLPSPIKEKSCCSSNPSSESGCYRYQHRPEQIKNNCCSTQVYYIQMEVDASISSGHEVSVYKEYTSFIRHLEQLIPANRHLTTADFRKSDPDLPLQPQLCFLSCYRI